MNSTKYISIGEYCMPAFIIRDVLHKRTEAYPFDWVFSKLKTVKTCIKDNFTELKEIILKKANHNVNEKIHFCVAHHDLKKIEDCEHYERAITRLIENMNSPENNIVFIHSSYFINYIDEDRIIMLNEIYDLIKDNYKCSYKIITLVFKKHDKDLFIINKNKNIYVIEIYTIREQTLKFWMEHIRIYAELINLAITECVNMI